MKPAGGSSGTGMQKYCSISCSNRARGRVFREITAQEETGRYHGVPALSRTDNKTLICPDCGTRQALDSLGISAEEQEKILSIIHKSYTEKER